MPWETRSRGRPSSSIFRSGSRRRSAASRWDLNTCHNMMIVGCGSVLGLDHPSAVRLRANCIPVTLRPRRVPQRQGLFLAVLTHDRSLQPGRAASPSAQVSGGSLHRHQRQDRSGRHSQASPGSRRNALRGGSLAHRISATPTGTSAGRVRLLSSWTFVDGSSGDCDQPFAGGGCRVATTAT
jgi:hypothetical protein